MSIDSTLPWLLAGPILRHTSDKQVSVWFACSAPLEITFSCFHQQSCIASKTFSASHQNQIRMGQHLWFHLVTLSPEAGFPLNEWLEYDLTLKHAQTNQCLDLSDLVPDLAYRDFKRPRFVVGDRIHQILHGSCRKPHHEGDDGLWVVDSTLSQHHKPTALAQDQPAFLMMSGDQVYVDDVAGPMLSAIHQVIHLLGIYDESIEGSVVAQGADLYASSHGFYQRNRLLPEIESNVGLRQRFFGGVKKPIFTTSHAENHLVTLAETLAMYLLVWSPELWAFGVEFTAYPETMAAEHRGKYQQETRSIQHFVKGLAKVRRAMANVPVYMIFDDHDVTDDWNLTRDWERCAYENPFSRRIIGNALIAYVVCQSWGNRAEGFDTDLLDEIKQIHPEGAHNARLHEQVIQSLLRYDGWQFVLDTQPRVVVLDTRTRRWRSETNAAHPSGLMDWEALGEMQQALIDQDAVILVSPAPIFGVKLIEVIQRVFTWCGQALTVDAENWMSHPGAAHVILNIFRHKKTPQHFVILSGDVHYSFVSDVTLRHRENSPLIWQVSSSGIKNQFPVQLLKVFDKFNAVLFASRSPLNWFTQRRQMRIKQRRPSAFQQRYRGQRLVNACNIGRVYFNSEGVPTTIQSLSTSGEVIEFTEGYERDWVH